MNPSRSFHAIVIALVVVLTACSNVAAAPEAGNWDPRFVASGIEQEVLALTPTSDGALLIGGRFGGDPTSPKAVTLWRQGRWSSLGVPPRDGVSGIVFAAASLGTNTYFGGEFWADNQGVSLNGIARWDGTSIHPLGSGPLAGVEGSVYALAASGADLIVAGRFRRLGAQAATNIARWNGTAWSTLGSGLGDGDSDRVSAVAVAPDGSLYAGGNFEVAGNKVVRRLARWDGSQWAEVGGGANGLVDALAWRHGQLFVGGAFDQVGANKIANLARWDGTNWFALGSGVDGEVNAFAVKDGKLFVGGAFTKVAGLNTGGIAAWTDSGWESLGSGVSGGSPAAVRTLTILGDRLIAGGSFYMAGSVVAPNVAIWDGSGWNSLEAGLAGGDTPRITALAAQGGSVTVGGSFTSAGGRAALRVAQWDGAAWQPMGAGFDKPPLALAYGPGLQVYAGGDFSTSGRRIARWDGASWSSLGGGITGEGTVWSIAVATNGDVYAGGIFTKIGNVTALGVARWNGQKWSTLGGGITSYGVAGTVHSLAFVGDQLYAAGTFSTAGGHDVNHLARWTGTTWEDVGGGLSFPGFQPTIHALAPWGTGIVAGGNFTMADRNAFPYLAFWDPATGAWSQLGGSPNGVVRTLAVLDDRLYAGGDFTTIAGLAAPGLARWDGAAWSDLAGSLGGDSPRATHLAAAGTNLWVAGSFAQVGQSRATDLARWWIPWNEPPTVAFTTPSDAAVFAAGASLRLKLSSSDPETQPVSVQILQNGQSLVHLDAPPFEFDWTDIFPDTYTLQATATDALGKRSAPVTIRITVAPPIGDLPPAISLTAPAPGTLLVGQPFTLSATATDPDGQVIRADFYRGKQPLGSVGSAPFQLKVPGFPAGDFEIVAVAVDNAGAKATSAPVALRVVAPGPAPDPKWTFATAANVRSSVAISPEGSIYLSPGPGLDQLVCLQPDGQIQWVYRDGGSVLTAPAVGKEGDIFAGRSDGRLLAVSPEGKRRWEFETGAPVRTAPAIGRDGTIYFGNDNHVVYALNPAGQKLWQFTASSASGESAPAVAADGAILFGTADGILYCLNPDGSERWRFAVPGSIDTAPALADDGVICFVSSLGSLFAVEPEGQLKWEYRSGSSSLGGSPVIGPDGTIYFGANDGNLHAVSPSGASKWTYTTGDAISGTPAIDAEGTIVFASNDRKIHAVFPTGFPKWNFLTEGRSGASAAIAHDGTILVGSGDQKLYALPGGAPLSPSQWPKFHRDSAQTGRGALLPQVVLDEPVAGSWFTTEESIHFRAHVSSPNGRIARVEFRLGEQVLGLRDAPPFEFDWTRPPSGVFSVHARGVDEVGASASSAPARILIAAGGEAPRISTAPQAATVGPGESLSLSVEVLSASMVSYQWFKDETPVPGANSALLTLSPTTAAMSAHYTVVARNASGAVTSAPTLVTVLLPPRPFWTREDLNRPYPPPAIGPAGNLYTAGNPSGIRCHDRAGTLVWMNTEVSPSSDIAVANDGTLFFGTGDGRLVALGATGRIAWTRPVSGGVNGIALTGDSTIYLTTDNGTLEAWSRDGTNRWVYVVGFKVSSAPVVTQAGTIVFGAFDGKLYGVRPSGQTAWDYDAQAIFGRTAAIAPDGSIVVPVGSRLLTLNPDGTHRRTHTAAGVASSPSIGPDGSVYFGITDASDPTTPPTGRVLALTPDGRAKWSTPIPYPVTTPPSLAADGTVFVASGPLMFALNPNGTWRSRHPSGGTVSSPTIGFDGTLYFCDGAGGLSAIGGTTAMPTNGWPAVGRDVRHRSDASSPADPDEWFFPLASNGFDGPVTSIAAATDGIYVAGDFTLAGGRPADRVAYWNGTNWFACGAGPGGRVRQLVTLGNQLFASGEFGSAPGAKPRLMMRWDGLSWYPADDGLVEVPGPLDTRNGEVYSIGLIRTEGAQDKASLLRYDGKQWSPVGEPFPAPSAHSLRNGPTGFHATAGSQVYRFDGANWSPVGPPLGDEVYVALETPLGLFAGGNFHDPTTHIGFVARWDGAAWVNVGPGLAQDPHYFGSAFLMSTQGKNLLVGGFFNKAGAIDTPGLARWDGTNWTGLLSSGFVSSESSGGPATLAVRGDELYLGGSFLRVNGDGNLRYFAVFTGADWSALGPKLVFLDGQLQLMLFNFLGRPFAVETSTDLRTWAQLYLYSNLEKPVSIPIRQDSGGNSRFIRVVVP